LDIARVQRRVAHVTQAKNLTGQSLRANGESPVERHANVEHAQVRFELAAFFGAFLITFWSGTGKGESVPFPAGAGHRAGPADSQETEISEMAKNIIPSPADSGPR
jgi:hypothetical protein